MNKSARFTWFQLALILAIALGHGLVYVWVVPPWQHYDESAHFEYAWLIAERGRLPQPGDYDPLMRLAVAQSMVRYGFYEGRTLPDLTVESVAIAPVLQLNDPPLYYVLISPVVRLVSPGRVTAQLYLLRMATLTFLLASVLAAWGVAVELTPPGHLLRWLLPLLPALLPGFVDIMTAVNDDAAAIGFTCLALWGAVRLVQRGPSWSGVILAAIPALLAAFAKEIGVVSLLVFALACFLSLIPQKRLGWALLALLVLAGIGTGLVLRREDAGFWYRASLQPDSLRVASPVAAHGEYALQVDATAATSPVWLAPTFQPIPPASLNRAEPLVLTVGAWMWLAEPGTVFGPQIGAKRWSKVKSFDLGLEPTFVAFTATLPSYQVSPFRLDLRPYRNAKQVRTQVYYDGLVVAQGGYPLDEPPVFADATAAAGEWGGRPFVNLLRNGSAEQPGLRLMPAVDLFLSRFVSERTQPSTFLAGWLDWQGSGWYFRTAFANLIRTFLGKFGWGHVPLPGAKPYRVLGYAGLGLLALSALWSAWSLRRRAAWGRVPWKAVLLLGLLLVVTWLSTWMRGAAHVGVAQVYVPVARYAMPAIIPTALLLCLGWAGLGQARRWSRYFSIIMFIVLFIGLSLFAVFGIRLFYIGR